MSKTPCTARIPMSTFTEYWLGELDAARQSELEEHLFECAECSSRLSELAQLGEAICRAMREGQMNAILTSDFVKKLQRSGVRIREYRLQPGESVLCTVTPEDDLVIAHLHAPLRHISRLDLLFSDATAGTRWRVEDVAFNPTAEEVALAPSVGRLRTHSFTQHLELLAVEGSGERVVARYTFNHSPHRKV
jgi:hypothetical protein